jgi:hypothetical protein
MVELIYSLVRREVRSKESSLLPFELRASYSVLFEAENGTCSIYTQHKRDRVLTLLGSRGIIRIQEVSYEGSMYIRRNRNPKNLAIHATLDVRYHLWV